MISEAKLKILTEGAKYDVSCSSSGSKRQNTGGMGNGYAMGCCHTFTPDGRCVSLLKILMSNDCVFNCKYCVNRCDADVPRATATPDELCELVIDFYKRNYIEGLFLSSAVCKTPNYTMERLYLTVKKLRTEYRFHGYVHVKGIPHADMALIRETAKYRAPFRTELKIACPAKE